LLLDSAALANFPIVWPRKRCGSVSMRPFMLFRPILPRVPAQLLVIPGAMDAGLNEFLFWAAWLLARGGRVRRLSGQSLADRGRQAPCCGS
jgi:hypothetical protein